MVRSGLLPNAGPRRPAATVSPADSVANGRIGRGDGSRYSTWSCIRKRRNYMLSAEDEQDFEISTTREITTADPEALRKRRRTGATTASSAGRLDASTSTDEATIAPGQLEGPAAVDWHHHTHLADVRLSLSDLDWKPGSLSVPSKEEDIVEYPKAASTINPQYDAQHLIGLLQEIDAHQECCKQLDRRIAVEEEEHGKLLVQVARFSRAAETRAHTIREDRAAAQQERRLLEEKKKQLPELCQRLRSSNTNMKLA